MKINTWDNALSSNIKKTSYYLSQNTNELFKVAELKKTKFSENGSNLAICLLSLNRVSLTIKLISSIEYYMPAFNGEILIIDNNSVFEQKNILKDFIATSSLTIKLKELNENLGVGRARNLAAELTEKDWLMYLDNDMYFIKDPIPIIKETIEQLGVQFVNLPLINYDNKTVFALGGCFFLHGSNNGFFLGGGSVFNFQNQVEFNDLKIDEPFLSDFLFGGASVINRQSFIDSGGFDINMFVGFEDIDYSLRLYNKGIKVGNINGFTLVHDHKPSENLNDVAAEKERFNNTIIKASAEAFKKKNGLVVYDQHTEEWLKQRQNELIHKTTANGDSSHVSQKKRIALVVDMRNWAFHNIAKNIVEHLGHKYDFTLYFQSEDYPTEQWQDIYPVFYKERYDILMFFWRPHCRHLFTDALKYYFKHNHNITAEEVNDFINNTVILTAVYDHLFLKTDQIENNLDLFTKVDGYIVSSNKLFEIYENIEGYNKPYATIQDGVDTNRFFKKDNKQFSSYEEPLVIGWAGNSLWGVAEDGIDHKGLNSIIKPAVEELIKEGYNIKLKYADRQEPETYITSSEINDFYNSLDVYVCTSDIEGTPNPVLESMACGIAVITTNVGIVREVFGAEQQKFILEERTKECLKKKLIALMEDRSILEKLAKENHIRISNWTWKSKCEKFEQFFNYYLQKHRVCKRKKFDTEHKSDTPSIDPELERYRTENDYLKQNATAIKTWYQNEYEVLPLWFKRLGHIVKVFQGRRTFKSLFSDK